MKPSEIAPSRDKVIDVIEVEVVAEVGAVAKTKLKNKIRNKIQQLKKM